MKSETAEKIKHLQTRRDVLQIEIDQALSNKREIEQRLDIAVNQRKKIDDEIKQLGMISEEIIVTEHAMLRYLERALNIDLNGVKKAILTDSLLASIAVCRSGKFPIAQGIKAVVKNNVVITIEN